MSTLGRLLQRGGFLPTTVLPPEDVNRLYGAIRDHVDRETWQAVLAVLPPAYPLPAMTRHGPNMLATLRRLNRSGLQKNDGSLPMRSVLRSLELLNTEDAADKVIKELLAKLTDWKPPPKPPVPGWIWLSLGVAIAGGVAVVLALDPAPKPVPDLRAPSGTEPPPGMALVEGAVFEMGTRPDEREWAVARCPPQFQKDCEEKLAREKPRVVAVPAFFLDVDEVTVAEFASWLDSATQSQRWFDSATLAQDIELADAPGKANVPHDQHGTLPVRGVTWFGASAYCRARQKRLPSEAEWELAARGKGRFRFPWGEDDPCNRNITGCCEARKTPRPSSILQTTSDQTASGVRHLAGNVAEWVADAYEPDPRRLDCNSVVEDDVCFVPHRDGDDSSRRSVRGGDFSSPVFACRSAMRGELAPLDTRNELGFRCAKEIR